MRAVLQRVSEARVEVDGVVVGRIGAGLLVLVGVGVEDTPADADRLAGKVAELRLFPPQGDSDGMERSVQEAGGSVLAVSQFTLMGDCRKGRRPSWSAAARPEHAQPLYERFVSAVRDRGIPVETGRFRTEMKVHLVNDGPVTVLVDTDQAR
ncbi:MAG: D-aminoacyl-tRNA deacylase [Armatimonadota bacterium]